MVSIKDPGIHWLCSQYQITTLWCLSIYQINFRITAYINRIEYRIGGHYGDNYLIINGEQIKEYGASIGIGIPMRRTLSKVNLYLDFTRKSGFSSSNYHAEDYLSAGISINLYDFWFLKHKYD